MKKQIIKITFVAAIAMACGINGFKAQKSESLSEIALANVEALADLKNNWFCVGEEGPCYEDDLVKIEGIKYIVEPD